VDSKPILSNGGRVQPFWKLVPNDWSCNVHRNSVGQTELWSEQPAYRDVGRAEIWPTKSVQLWPRVYENTGESCRRLSVWHV